MMALEIAIGERQAVIQAHQGGFTLGQQVCQPQVEPPPRPVPAPVRLGPDLNRLATRLRHKDPQAGQRGFRGAGSGIVDARVPLEKPARHYFFFALNSLMYFSGFSLKASRQPEQQT